jgi:hypothetical protein
MRSHRLARLARLTQGAALVGAGLFDSGCKKEQVEPPHINATATPTTEPPPPTEDAGLAPPTINAPPTPPDAGRIMRHTVNATATPPSPASGPKLP